LQRVEQNVKGKAKVKSNTCFSAFYSSPEALYNLASGNWSTSANDTAAHYAAIHCPSKRTTVIPIVIQQIERSRWFLRFPEICQMNLSLHVFQFWHKTGISRRRLLPTECSYTPFTRRSKHEANVLNIQLHNVCSKFVLCLLHVSFMMFASSCKRGVIYCVVNSWAFICKITAICTMLHRCRNSRLACVFPCTFRTVGIRSASHAFAICQRSVTHEALCTTSRPDVIMTYGRSVVYDLSSVTLRCPRCGGRDRTFIHTLMKLSFRWLLPSTSARHRRGGVDF